MSYEDLQERVEKLESKAFWWDIVAGMVVTIAVFGLLDLFKGIFF